MRTFSLRVVPIAIVRRGAKVYSLTASLSIVVPARPELCRRGSALIPAIDTPFFFAFFLLFSIVAVYAVDRSGVDRR